MKRKCLQLTALTMALLLLLFSLAACAGNGETRETTGEDASTDAPETLGADTDATEEGELPTEEEIPTYTDGESESTETPTLPSQPVDLDGYVYKAYVRSKNSGSGAFWCEDFWVSAPSTAPISHAVYQRNLTVEALYNCRIKQVDALTKEQYGELKQYYLDGETFELAIILAVGAASCAATGLIQDVATLPNLHTESVVYDQNLIKDLSLGGGIYFLGGDMNVSPWDSTATTIYRPTLHGSYDFGELLGHPEYNDLYTLVKDGGWTMDAMLSMANAVSNDTDHSGGVLDATAGDTVGYFQYSASAQYYFYGHGARITENGADGYPTVVYHTQEAQRTFSTLFDALNVTVKHPTMPYGGSGLRQSYYASGNTLFTDILLWDVRKVYHESDYDYGILPIPKASPTQERYVDLVYFPYQTAHFWTLPTLCESVNNATLVLQKIAESSADVKSVYIDVTLDVDYASTPAARETLRTVMQSTAYDLNLLYNWGGFHTQTLAKLPVAEKNAYGEALTEAALNQTNEEMEKTLSVFRAPVSPKPDAKGLTFALLMDGASYGVIGCTDKTLTQIVIPAEFQGLAVTRICSDAFREMECLESVVIPASVTSIGTHAFYHCTALREVTLPAQLTHVGEYAFSGCTSLESVTIPASVTEIGRSAFEGCDSLTYATFEATEGWHLYTYLDESFSTPAGLAEILADPAQAAIQLRGTYCEYVWQIETEQ